MGKGIDEGLIITSLGKGIEDGKAKRGGNSRRVTFCMFYLCVCCHLHKTKHNSCTMLGLVGCVQVSQSAPEADRV